MSVKIISEWTLPDSLFFPFSIHSVGDNNKVVLIVTGNGQIFTLVIKNLQLNIYSGGSPQKISRIKLAETDLVDTIVTSMNTISLKSNGELVVFYSFRECTTVEGINGVKAICAMEKGKQILILRLINERSLQLEVFDDLSGCNMGDRLKSFDLSWEKNAFDTNRKSQVHIIKTISIHRGNSKFFRRFLNCSDLLEETELILFTMDNGLYWLKILNDSYEIVTVKIYPALIVDFSFAASTCCFAVLLANAVMQIYSISEDTNSLLIQEDSRHLGHNIECHIFVTEHSTLLYSSKFQITQIRYYYSEINKSIQHVAKDIPIFGVSGITYLSFAEMAICVTENRLFYSIPINKLPDFNDQQQNEYFELTKEILSQANQMTCFLTNEVNNEIRITKEIKHERQELDILTSALNENLYNQFFAGDCKYLNNPLRCSSTLILGESNNSNVLVRIDVSIKNNIKEVILRQQNWKLVLWINDVVTQIPLSNVNYLDDNTVRLLASVDESAFKKHGLPRIETSMSIRISHCQESLQLDIPIKIKSVYDIPELCEASSFVPKTLEVQGSHLPRSVGDLIRHCEHLPAISQQAIGFTIRGSNDVLNVDELLSLMGIAINPNSVDKPLDKAYITLGHQICEVKQYEQHEFQFKSTAPGMLFVLKILLQSKYKEMLQVPSQHLKATRLQLAQCETERDRMVSYYQQIRAASGTWQ